MIPHFSKRKPKANTEPINKALLAKQNYWASTEQCVFYTDPELDDFRNWVSQNGKASYAKFLLLHPRYSLGEIWKNRKIIFHSDRYYLEVYESSEFVASRLYATGAVSNGLIYLFFIIASLLLFVASVRLGNKIEFLKLFSILSIFFPIAALFFVSFHGDAMEVSRHTIPAVILLKVWLTIVLFFIGDGVFDVSRRAAPCGSKVSITST
jgi:hypothetical protein